MPDRNDRNFVIPYEFTVVDGDPFLRYDNQRDDRMVMFGSGESLEFLSQSDHWFMDGTFRIAPPQFAQLYTIHGLRGGRNVVGAYALLLDKRRDTYVEMLTELRHMTMNASPVSVLTDFEMGAVSAMRAVHPNTTQKGCLFHLSQSVYRKVQASGLQGIYLEDEAFRTNVRMLPALAFVPLNDVENAFMAVSAAWGGRGRDVLTYFEETYIGQLRAGHREQPMFVRSFWNVVDRVEEDLPRTNNSLEGWHSAFARSITCARPSVWTFIRSVKQENAMSSLTIAQVEGGQPPVPQRLAYRKINERLRTVFRDYANRNVLDYLRAISYNLWQ